MHPHMKKILQDSERETARFLAHRIRTEGDPAFGAMLMDGKYPEPKPTLYSTAEALACFLNQHSRYYRDPSVAKAAEESIEYASSCVHEDGTLDFTPCNFHSAPDTGFVLYKLINLHDLMVKKQNDSLTGLPDGIVCSLTSLIASLAKGVASGGFHTPNHRWVIAATLRACARITGESAYTEISDRFLLERIDINEDGEYAERSAGGYNIVNNDQMLMLYRETGDRQYIEYVARNLRMMKHYVEPDGSIFTGNSTRQDRGATVWMDAYWYAFYVTGKVLGDAEFLNTARLIMDDASAAGRPVLEVLARTMTLGEDVEYATTSPDSGDVESSGPGNGISALHPEYRRLYEDSGILRIRNGGWSCSLLRDYPRFFHFHAGSFTVTLKIGVAYFQYREFKPHSISAFDAGHSVEGTMHGWYYLPFGEYQGTSDWWKMNNKSRLVKDGPDLAFRIKLFERPDGDGVDLLLETSGCPGVPLRFELAIDPDTILESAVARLPASAGGWMLGKDGFLRVSKNGESVNIGPFFAEHADTGGTYGSEARSPDRFTVYATAFTPCARILSFMRLE